ncbi:unnamed protein product [Schistosoma margrebowiei]|uniref:Uncharacterized protein n=1 Tax=Schistosoma margrebowiei TaxID=48269 RepID=A0AA85AG43_9TREM|nr:unnamed protein product [Schistosoma margrebowiei]
MLIRLFIIVLFFIDHNDSKPSNSNETTTISKPTSSSNMTRLNKGQLWLDHLFSLMDKAEFLEDEIGVLDLTVKAGQEEECSKQPNIICKFSNMIDWFVS